MQYYIISNDVIVNIPVVDTDDAQQVADANSRGWVLGEEGFNIGDYYIDGEFQYKPEQPQVEPFILIDPNIAQYLIEIDYRLLLLEWGITT